MGWTEFCFIKLKVIEGKLVIGHDHIKLEIEFQQQGREDTGYGLGRFWRIADLHCRKVESTKWLKHKLKATIGGQKQIWISFSLGFIMQAFGGP